MNKIDIDRKTFMWFIKKVKDLKPNKKEIKIGKYIFDFKYVRVKIWFGEMYDEVDFPAISSRATKMDLENILMLEFWVYGLDNNYITTVEMHKNDNENYQMYIYPDRTKEDINEFINAIYDEINKDGIIKKEEMIQKLNEVINYLNEGCNEAFNDGEDEYCVDITEMLLNAINPLAEILNYLIGDEK